MDQIGARLEAQGHLIEGLGVLGVNPLAPCRVGQVDIAVICGLYDVAQVVGDLVDPLDLEELALDVGQGVRPGIGELNEVVFLQEGRHPWADLGQRYRS